MKTLKTQKRAQNKNVCKLWINNVKLHVYSMVQCSV